MKHRKATVVVLAVLGAAASLQQDKTQLREALRDTEIQGDWIYDDAEAGFAKAKATGKPLLFTFR
jgi:hypothetical protein